jgi:membrane-bound metal-dependent hydrolase YbcI (DUF457 family)
MPSPLGHALAGAAAGWTLAPGLRAGDLWTRLWREGLLFAGLAMAPDLDLLAGTHRGPTHSLAAACVAGALVWLVSGNRRLGVASAAAYGTHVFLDWLGADSSPPLGLMVWWPFDHGFYESGLSVFPAVTRRLRMEGFWMQNLRAGLFELAVLLPPWLIALWFRRRRLAKNTHRRLVKNTNRRQEGTGGNRI